jgi:hypothetical protein
MKLVDRSQIVRRQMVDVLPGLLQRRKDEAAKILAGVMGLDGIVRQLFLLLGTELFLLLSRLIGRPRQPASPARHVCFSRTSHASGKHPFETTHPISKIGHLLPHPHHID